MAVVNRVDVPGISVVIPVYNAGPYLEQCLDSLMNQDINPSLLEIVAVDDGSTDGSPMVLEQYAAKHPDFRVLRQENSGGPGGPRNVGLQACRREYVFFADADDYLGPEALRRMYEFANRHGSDVTIPRLIGVGRFIHQRAWAQTQVDADLRLAFLTMSPQKLIRRSLIEKHGLRFPEGAIRFEDGIFLARAYLTASRVSLLGDYDYYFIRLRDDLGNRGEQEFEPYGFCDSLRAAMDTMRELCPDRELAEDLVLDLYRRKALKPFTPERFPWWSDDRRRNWVKAVGALAEGHVPAQHEERLVYPFNLRSHLARIGDVDALVHHTTAVARGDVRGHVAEGRVLVGVDTVEGPVTYDATSRVRIRAELERVSRGLGKLLVHGRARVDGMEVDGLSVCLVLRDRTSGAERVVAAKPRGSSDGWARFEAAVRIGTFPSAPATAADEVWSALVRVDHADSRRVSRVAVAGGPRRRRKANLPVSLPIRRSRFEAQPYVTRYGNLAIRVEAMTTPPARRRINTARIAFRVARRRLRRLRAELAPSS